MTAAERHPILHRWFVQYNPTLLVSAALVLWGVIALSDSLARDGTTLAQLGITAIAEVYAWALIGSAALLVRLHLRRPATMLAYLALVFCSDPTLHTATTTHLGSVGILGSLVWGASLLLKLRTLSWAMQLRLSRSAWAVLLAGGLGLVVMPWLLLALPPTIGTTVLWTWVFSVLAAGLWSTRLVVSKVRLDSWPATVARRSMRWIWTGLALVLVGHALFWTEQHAPRLEALPLFPMAVLLATRWATSEGRTWTIVGTSLAWVAFVMPSHLWLVALFSAAVLVLRVVRRPVVLQVEPHPDAAGSPYRLVAAAPRDAILPVHAFSITRGDECLRLLVGAASCLHVSVWTMGWHGGHALPHVWPADLVLFAVGIAVAWRLGKGLPTVPGLAVLTHGLAHSPWLPRPQSTTEWGATAVVAGFALLALSVLVTIRLARPPTSR